MIDFAGSLGWEVDLDGWWTWMIDWVVCLVGWFDWVARMTGWMVDLDY
jgi:hypothetical protein